MKVWVLLERPDSDTCNLLDVYRSELGAISRRDAEKTHFYNRGVDYEIEEKELLE